MTPQKPTFLIIGSAKCGTSALASILSHHPNCCMSRPKEVGYFLDTIDYKPTNPNYEQGWDWYKQAFSHYNGEAAIGEATPNYAARTRSPGTAQKIYAFNPEMKLIYMVRNPLEKQLSGWKMLYAALQDEEVPPTEEHKWAAKGIDYWMQMKRDHNQWDDCCYGYQIEAYETFFPTENICVSFLEDWTHSKQDEVNRILRFLVLDPALMPDKIEEKTNRGSERKVNRPLVKKLRAHPAMRAIIKRLPADWRNWSRAKITTKRMIYPTVEMSSAVKDDFVDYIADDVQCFLAQQGKPQDFWPSVLMEQKID